MTSMAGGAAAAWKAVGGAAEREEGMLRRQSRWGEIDYYLINLLKRELQEKYFVGTGSEDDYWKEQEYSLKPGIRAEDLSEELLRFACYVAVSYKIYGANYEYFSTNYLLGPLFPGLLQVRPKRGEKTV